MEPIKVNLDRFKKAPIKNMHSGLHTITNEVWEYCGKDKPFAFYLGIIKRIGDDRARFILANMRDKPTPAHTPGKLFVFLSKKQ